VARGIDYPDAGQTYLTETILPGLVPAMPVTAIPPPADWAFYYVEVTWDSPVEVVYGQNLFTGFVAHPGFTPGRVDLTATDAPNHALLEAGDPYDAFVVERLSSQGSVVLPLSLAMEHPWYFHFQAEERMNATAAVHVRATLYENTMALGPVETLRVRRVPGSGYDLSWDPVESVNVEAYNVYRSTSVSDIRSVLGKAAIAPFLLGTEPTTAASSWPEAAAPAGVPLVFWTVRSYGLGGRISN
jgi:hypothetical protein